MEKLQANTDKGIIMDKLSMHWDALEKKGWHLAGLFCQGRQNYKLDREGDSVDAYAVVFPSTEHFAYDLPMTAREKLPGGEVVIKDIRLFAKDLLSGRHEILELLLTPYRIVGWPYFKPLLNTGLKERLLTYDMPGTVKSLLKRADALKDHICGMPQEEQLYAVAEIYTLLSAASVLVDCAKRYEGGMKNARVVDDFCHAFLGDMPFPESRPADMQYVQHTVQYATDIAEKCSQWSASAKPQEDSRRETRRMVAEWVESAFTVFWTK